MESEIYMDGWYYWACLSTGLATCFSWILFGRISMARIERLLKDKGISRPCPWDGPGARIVWYAWAIALPVGRFNRLDDPLINVPLVKRYSNRSDRVIARLMVLSTAAFLVAGFIGPFLG